MGTTVVYVMLFAGTAFFASGLGSLLVGRSAIEPPLRALRAQYLIGFLTYSALFALAAHLQLRFSTTVALALVLLVLALFGFIRFAYSHGEGSFVRRFGKDTLARILLAVVIGCSLGAFWRVLGNPVAADPRNYAYLAVSTFHDDWLQELVWVPAARRPILDVSYLGRLTRAPDVAMLWPTAAFARGVGIDMVTQAGAWFLVVTFVLLADILSGLVPLLARLALAAGGIGAFNAASALTAGQINQPVALVTIVTAVWICRFTDAVWTRLLTLTLVGYVLASGYPEFLIAVPLYFCCIVVVRPTSWRRVVSEIAAIALGALFADLTTGFASHRFIASQSSAVPTWSPLPASPRGVVGLWTAIALQHSPRWWLLLIVFVAGVYVWRSRTPSMTLTGEQIPLWLAVATGLTFMAGLWSWAVLRADNINYATFKLGGWLGPGLMLLGGSLLRYARPAGRLALGTVLLTVAASRCVVLAQQLPTMNPSGAWRPVWTSEPTPGRDSRCRVRVASQRYDVVLRTIAESAAPMRGCALEVSGSSAVAAVYEAKPPTNWRPNETKTYVVGVENAGLAMWVVNGAGAVRLAVRFTTPDSDGGDWTSFGLPVPVPPGARTKVRVEMSAPAGRGTYLLEHRLVQGPMWSEQSSAVRVTVR
jgi:hypothetical protein